MGGEEEKKNRGSQDKPAAEAGGVTACCRRTISAMYLAVVFLLPPPSLVWADPPFLTDDTGTQGAGKWKFELEFQRDRNSALADAGAGPMQRQTRQTQISPVLTYGLREDLDISVGGNYLRYRDTDNGVVTTEASGASDSSIGLKWRFHEKGDFSLAVASAVSLPTGDENRGLGTGKASWGASFIADYDAEPWSCFANVAYTHQRYRLAQDSADSRRDLWRASAGVTYEVRENFWLGGELGVRTNEARNDPFAPGNYGRFVMLGMIYSPAKKVELNAAVRKGLNDAEPDTVWLAGVSFRW
jgi:hypothetical protein